MHLTANQSDVLKQLIEYEKQGKLDREYFDDIPIEVYHHPECPGISSTRLKMVYKNDYKPVEETEALFFGRAFHCYILEPELFLKTYSIGVIDKCLQYLSWQEYEMLQAMKVALEAHPLYKNYFVGGASERTFFSRDNVTNTLKKCRTDKIKGMSVADLKTTTNASESNFIYSAKKYGYGFSGAYYLGIVSEVLGTRTDDFTMWAVEKKIEDPKIGVYMPNFGSLERSDLAVREALETYSMELDYKKQNKVKSFIGCSPDVKQVWL